MAHLFWGQKKKGLLDQLMQSCKVQPVGYGYIDCIVLKEYVSDFVNGLTGLGIRITTLSWWCHCTEESKAAQGCPHGMGGPKSLFFDGWFSEMCYMSFVEFKENSDVLPYLFDIWPREKDYLECLVPGFWLDVPKKWRNTV